MANHRMNLSASDASSLDVTLDIDNTVELRRPELMLYVRPPQGSPKYEKKTPVSTTESSANWRVPVRNPAYTSFEIYWDAVEPMQGKLPYTATVTVCEVVNDKVGDLLEEDNPKAFDCKVGTVDPGAGSEMVKVVVK